MTRMILTSLVLAFALGQAEAAVYDVGAGQPYTSINAVPLATLQPGDTVQIHSGTYNETVRVLAGGAAGSPIRFIGVGATRPIIDANGLNVSGAGSVPRAAFQVMGDHTFIQNLEFKNARNGNNGAGIRVTSGTGSVITDCVIDHCKIDYNDMGMQSDTNDQLLVQHSEICFNGTSAFNGYSHNFYLIGDRTTVQYCYIHDALYGQNFKTRGHYTELLYNLIVDSNEGEVGFDVDPGITDIPNSNAVLVGNVIVSSASRTGNHAKYIDYIQHQGTLYAFNNTLVAGSGNIHFLSPQSASDNVVAVNNIFYGSNNLVDLNGGALSGDSNWLPSGATVPPGFVNSVIGAAPGFVNAGARDFHLLAASACINAGSNSFSYMDGRGVAHTGLPVYEFAAPQTFTARASDGSLDVGAYEGPQLSPTQTPTRTRTATPSRTPTLSPSFSSTPSFTPTRSTTLSSTVSMTPTLSSTQSSTFTFSATPTLSGTATPSPTPSATPTLSTSTPTSSRTLSASPSPSPSSPSVTSTLTASFTASPSVSSTQPPASATPSPSSTASPSFSPTALAATGTSTASATASSTRTQTLISSPTASATRTVTAVPTTAALTATSTAMASSTATITATPPSLPPASSPTATSTVTNGATTLATTAATPLAGGGTNAIEAHACVPSPWSGQGPAWISVQLKGRVDSLRVKFYTPALTCLGQSEVGPRGAGWAQVPLPLEMQASAAGAYHYVIESRRQGDAEPARAVGTMLVLR